MAAMSSILSLPIQSHRLKFPHTLSEPTIYRISQKESKTATVTANMKSPLSFSPALGPLSSKHQNEFVIEKEREDEDPLVLAKLYEISAAACDRAEMHANLAEQRNNWNTLFHNSINSLTLAATILSSSSIHLSSTFLFSASAFLLCLVNKIQPSQLAEEQRNATRLFRDLHIHIENTLRLHPSLRPNLANLVNECIASVLAIDKAYPLPLLPGMLEKFPTVVEPAVWWPNKEEDSCGIRVQIGDANNGWSKKTENQMEGVLKTLKKKDIADYVRLSKLVLRVNRVLALAGPALCALGAAGSAIGGPGFVVGAVCGAMAAFVNSVEHGGQVGMVFEMYRNCGGLYKMIEKNIERALDEREFGRRENAEILEMRVALQLGRSLSSLQNMSENSEKFAGKLF